MSFWSLEDIVPEQHEYSINNNTISARPWEKVSYAICEQQRRRLACASAQSDQRLCCSLPRQNDTSSLYIWNFKILASLCSWAGQVVSCLVGGSRRYIFSWRGSYTCKITSSLINENDKCCNYISSWHGSMIICHRGQIWGPSIDQSIQYRFFHIRQ